LANWLLYQITFGSVAGFTKQLNVASGVAAAFRDGDNVVVFQFYLTAAVRAFTLVPSPHFSFHFGWLFAHGRYSIALYPVRPIQTAFASVGFQRH